VKKEELICDYCGKVSKGDEHHFNLPKGWFVLGFHCQSFVAPEEWRVTHHFCSSECLNSGVRVVPFKVIPKEEER